MAIRFSFPPVPASCRVVGESLSSATTIAALRVKFKNYLLSLAQLACRQRDAPCFISVYSVRGKSGKRRQEPCHPRKNRVMPHRHQSTAVMPLRYQPPAERFRANRAEKRGQVSCQLAPQNACQLRKKLLTFFSPRPLSPSPPPCPTPAACSTPTRLRPLSARPSFSRRPK